MILFLNTSKTFTSMRIIILTILIVFSLLIYPSIVPADFYSEAEKMKEFNPDGKKYEFVRDYLTSLSYIYANFKQTNTSDLVGNYKSDRNKGAALLSGMVQENANLRVAKNYMDKYLRSSNGLMMKTADLYIKLCDQLINLNQKERNLYQSLFEAQSSGKIEAFEENAFNTEREALAAERNVSVKGFIETSYYTQKILVSSKPDRFGELVDLGLTKNQRVKLIAKIEELFPGLQKEIKGTGVSTIDASVMVVKERLVDDTWGDIR